MGTQITPLAAPQEVQATGIPRGLLEDLALKTLYLHGEMSVVQLGDHMCLGAGAIEEIFWFIRKEQLCEVKGMSGSHRIVASAQGKQRAAGLLLVNAYAGAAPVSLADYSARIRAQSVRRATIRPADIARALGELVLSEDILTRLGTAVLSGTSALLYGPSGTGKTSISTAIPAIYNDSVWVPQAVEVDGQIITVYDPGVHEAGAGVLAYDSDRRWVECARPCVFVGGELTAEMLDLPPGLSSRCYAAPLQMKANNGVLIVDDLGRQRMRPEELLNRWMTPLDRGIDFLTLPGGKKFEIPFDPFVVFSTNLEASQLADEAFMRRVPNKIKLDYATPEQFIEIFHRECDARLLSSEGGVPENLVRHIREDLKHPLNQCQVHDLFNLVLWTATYNGVQPRITFESLREACQKYFVMSAGS